MYKAEYLGKDEFNNCILSDKFTRLFQFLSSINIPTMTAVTVLSDSWHYSF
jgi:hypothetical protein